MANTFSLDVSGSPRIVDYVVDYGSGRTRYSTENSPNFQLDHRWMGGSTIWIRMADSVKQVRFTVIDDRGNAWDCGTVNASEIREVRIG